MFRALSGSLPCVPTLVLHSCRFPESSLSITLSFSYPLALCLFFGTCERASARASPRKASSRAIPVITTTSIFVKSLSPLSSSPSSPLLTPSPPTVWSFDLPLYKPGRYTGRKSAATSAVAVTAWYFPNYKFLRLTRVILALRFYVPIRFRWYFFPFRSLLPRDTVSHWICPILCIEQEKDEREYVNTSR